MRKFAPARVSYRDDFLILFPVYKMTGSFHISLFEGTLHDSKIYVRFKIANITHALPVPVHRQTDFPPKRVVFVLSVAFCSISSQPSMTARTQWALKSHLRK